MSAQIHAKKQATPKTVSGSRSDAVEHWLARKMSFDVKSRVRLWQRLHRFAERGHDIRAALEGMQERMNRKKDMRRHVWRRWLFGMRNGAKFSTVLQGYVPEAELLMVSAGEETGRMAIGFTQAAYVAQAARRFKDAIVSALAYPALLLVMLGFMLWLVSSHMVPAMEAMAPVESWPPITRGLYHVSNYVRSWGLITVGLMVAVAIVIAKTLPTWQGNTRRFLDKWMLPWTIYREFQGATMLIAVSALIVAGRPFETALRQVNSVAAPWLRWHITRMIGALRQGFEEGRAMDTGLLHEETLGDLEDYARAGAFAAAVKAVGEDVIEDGIARIKRYAFFAFVAVLLMVGGMLIWTYGSFVFLALEVKEQTSGANSMVR